MSNLLSGTRGVIVRQAIFFLVLIATLVALGKACDYVRRSDEERQNPFGGQTDQTEVTP